MIKRTKGKEWKRDRTSVTPDCLFSRQTFWGEDVATVFLIAVATVHAKPRLPFSFAFAFEFVSFSLSAWHFRRFSGQSHFYYFMIMCCHQLWDKKRENVARSDGTRTASMLVADRVVCLSIVVQYWILFYVQEKLCQGFVNVPWLDCVIHRRPRTLRQGGYLESIRNV